GMYLYLSDNSLICAQSAYIAKVRLQTAGDDDYVDSQNRESRPVAEDPDLAVELDVGHALLARESLQRIRCFDVAHLGNVGVTGKRAVVDGELRVERLHLALRRDDQRIDLAQHRVRLDEAAIEVLDDRG